MGGLVHWWMGRIHRKRCKIFRSLVWNDHNHHHHNCIIRPSHLVGRITPSIVQADLHRDVCRRLYNWWFYHKRCILEARVWQAIAERIQWSSRSLEITICTAFHWIVHHRRNLRVVKKQQISSHVEVRNNKKNNEKYCTVSQQTDNVVRLACLQDSSH